MTAAAALIARMMVDVAPMLEDPPGGSYVFVLLPEDLDPFERHYRFGAMLDAELRLAGAGCDIGGGTLFDAEEDGNDDVLFTMLEFDMVDCVAARAILRLHLPELGCPAGTLIHHGDDREDRWDGAIWHIDGARSCSVWD